MVSLFLPRLQWVRKFTHAEKWLKQVVDENPAHFKGLRMLINLEIKLKRSHKTIKNYINRILQFLPHDSESIKWIDDMSLFENAISKKENIEKFSENLVQLEVSGNTKHFEVFSSFSLRKVIKVLKYLSIFKALGFLGFVNM